MNRIVHFEIAANDLVKVTMFYKSVFGWNIQKWGNEEYWIAITSDKDSPGIDGGFFKPQGPMPGNSCVNTVQVANLDEALEKIKSNGENIVVEKRAIPTIGWLAYGTDVEGILFGMMQEDPNAK
jgi:uncharacterized protein